MILINCNWVSTRWQWSVSIQTCYSLDGPGFEL